MAVLPAPAARHAERLGGLLPRADLLGILGLTRHEVDNLVKGGAILPVTRSQYRPAGTPLTPALQLHAEVRRARGLATGPSLLALARAQGVDLESPWWVAIERERRHRAPGVDVIRVDVPREHRTKRDRIPSTSIELALAVWFPRADRAVFRLAFHDLRRRRLLDVRRLRLLLRQPVPGGPHLLAALDDGSLLAESPPEDVLGRLWRPGDPVPARQVWVAQGAQYYRLDLCFLGSRVAPEYDGAAAHEHRRQEDAGRHLALAELGILRLPVTSAQLRDPQALRTQILRIHHRRLAEGVEPLIPASPPPWWNGV
jgi:hypothetical protein